MQSRFGQNFVYHKQPSPYVKKSLLLYNVDRSVSWALRTVPSFPGVRMQVA